jgi:guanine nucleotide exchange factor VAV
MKVYEKHMEGVPHYYLSESRFFKSIMELITCYEHASLSENFVGYVAVHSSLINMSLL